MRHPTQVSVSLIHRNKIKESDELKGFKRLASKSQPGRILLEDQCTPTSSNEDEQRLAAHTAGHSPLGLPRSPESWPLEMAMGGFRSDPFDALPIPASRELQETMDYCRCRGQWIQRINLTGSSQSCVCCSTADSGLWSEIQQRVARCDISPCDATSRPLRSVVLPVESVEHESARC